MTTLLQAERLLIRRARKALTHADACTFHDAAGALVARMTPEQDGIGRIARRFGLHQLITWRFAVRDETDALVLRATVRNAGLRARVEVTHAGGTPAGTITQRVRLNKGRFDLLDASGGALGEVEVASARAWEVVFRDAHGSEAGRLVKRLAGAMTEIHSTGGQYDLTIHPGVARDMRLVVLAAAAAGDLLLRDTGMP